MLRLLLKSRRSILVIILFQCLRFQTAVAFSRPHPPIATTSMTAVATTSLSRKKAEPLRMSTTDDNNKNNAETGATMTPTTLVVGATGRIGSRCVQELLDANHRVRAIVRNQTKAEELLDVSNPNLELIICDLGLVAKDGTNQTQLEEAVQGCDSILSVSGTVRYSKWIDFVLPWRVVKFDASLWAPSVHPYFGNYKAQKMLIDLAEQNYIRRFVRITGLSAGYSAFHPVSMLFGAIVSLSNRYHYACEQYLRNSKVPYLVLRPGGMVYENRDPTKASLQVDASGSLSASAKESRIARSDVVALAVAAASSSTLPEDRSYTLAIRGVGEMEEGKFQDKKADGYETAVESLQSIQNRPTAIIHEAKKKPYGLAVALFVYSLTAISITLTTLLAKGIGKLFFKVASLVS